jgi:hypothetical protein
MLRVNMPDMQTITKKGQPKQYNRQDMRTCIREEVAAGLTVMKEQISKEVIDEITSDLNDKLASMKLLLGGELGDVIMARVEESLIPRLTEMVAANITAASTEYNPAATTYQSQMDPPPAPPSSLSSSLSIPDETVDTRTDLARQPDMNTVALVQRETQTAVAAMGRRVYAQVITEINERVVPQVDSMMQMMRYKMEDGTEVIDSYRRAVEYQSRAADGTLAITDGTIDKRVISPHVRMFFGGPDEDDE